MSRICAYAMERIEVESDRDGFRKYVEYVSNKIFFEYHLTNELFTVFRCYGYDGTDDNLIGDVEISNEQFEDFMINYEDMDYNDYDKRVLGKIKQYFDDGNWLLQLRLEYD